MKRKNSSTSAWNLSTRVVNVLFFWQTRTPFSNRAHHYMRAAHEEAPWGKNRLRTSHVTNKGSLTHRGERRRRAVNEFAETSFYNPLHGCQTQSRLIRGNVWPHYGEPSLSQTLAVSCDQQESGRGVREVRGRRPGRQHNNAVLSEHCHGFYYFFYQTQLLNYLHKDFSLSGPDFFPADSQV